jgi:hypothetical protein
VRSAQQAVNFSVADPAGTRRGMFEITIGSLKTTPPRMLRIVPFGERYISLRPNSRTRVSSGVMVAHLDAHAVALDRLGGGDRRA